MPHEYSDLIAAFENRFDAHNIPKEEDTALYTACLDSDFKKVTQPLEEGVNVNYKHTGGSTPLHRACKNLLDQEIDADTIVRIIELLTAKGADINSKDDYGNTPLHWVCSHLLNEEQEIDSDTIIKIIELLIAQGADVNNKNDEGETPLHWICANNLQEVDTEKIIKIIELLIAKGADIHCQNKDGMSPVSYAAAIADENSQLSPGFGYSSL